MIAKLEYPALYESASQLSASAQINYLRLIKAEYCALFFASCLALDFSKSKEYFALKAIVILVSASILVFRSIRKPEQDWYRGRALAESIKTSCWKYCMKAEPFGTGDNEVHSRKEFINYLSQILNTNQKIGEYLPKEKESVDQITTSMISIRSMPFDQKIEYYDTHRVKDQLSWYKNKAKINKRFSLVWFLCALIFYCCAIFISIAQVAEPQFNFMPIDPVLVLASSVLGWTQVKKFNELSSSYTLTSHEIGLIHGRIGEIKTEEDFAIFVVEAEQAFSREHTQWVARQQS